MFNKAPAPRFSTDLFTYDKAAKAFVSEASLLTYTGSPLSGCLSDQPAEQGLILVSTRTGIAVRFTFEQDFYDHEQDLVKKVFKIHPIDATRYSVSADTRVIVFNT